MGILALKAKKRPLWPPRKWKGKAYLWIYMLVVIKSGMQSSLLNKMSGSEQELIREIPDLQSNCLECSKGTSRSFFIWQSLMSSWRGNEWLRHILYSQSCSFKDPEALVLTKSRHFEGIPFLLHLRIHLCYLVTSGVKKLWIERLPHGRKCIQEKVVISPDAYLLLARVLLLLHSRVLCKINMTKIMLKLLIKGYSVKGFWQIQ